MKNFITKQIEAGKKIKGLKGLIKMKPTIDCGKGSIGEMYIFVTVMKMISENCGQIQLNVIPLCEHYSEDDKGFNISPSGFYESIDEIKKVNKYREILSQYNSCVQSIQNSHRLVSQRRDALKDLYNRSTDAAKAIIDKELAEKSTTLSKIDSGWFHEYAQILAKPIYFPDVDSEEVDEDESWDD